MTDDDLITLEAAAALIPGATAASLRHHIRAGRLKAYKPGKAYLTTRSDLRAMIESTAVKVTPQPRLSPFRHEPPLPLGLTDMDVANMSLQRVLEEGFAQHRAKREAAKAARKAESERIKRERAVEKAQAKKRKR